MAEPLRPNRIQWLRQSQGLSQAALAHFANTTPRQIGRLERGERQLSQKWIERLTKALGCSADDILLQTPEAYAAERALKEQTDLNISAELIGDVRYITLGRDSFFALGVYDLRVSGFGAANKEPVAPDSFVMFRSDWLRSATAARSGDLIVVRVAGDSMWETLHDGDHVLVDRSISRVGREGIYVLREPVSGELMVKRCQRNLRTRLLTIKSDNPVYPTQEDVPDDEVVVLGRVIWIDRQI